MTKKRGVDWLLLALVIVGALAVLAPFYLILVNSFKSPIDYATGGPLALPESLDFTGIVNFWERVNFPEKVWNSIFISGVVAVLAVLISMLNAFAIGIGRVRGRTWIVLLFLLANLLPQEALLYPLYYMFKEVGLYDNVWSVIIIFTVIQAAFGTYLLVGGLRHLPEGDPRGGVASTAPAAGRSCGGSSSRSAARPCRCCSSSSSSGRGTSSSSR